MQAYRLTSLIPNPSPIKGEASKKTVTLQLWDAPPLVRQGQQQHQVWHSCLFPILPSVS